MPCRDPITPRAISSHSVNPVETSPNIQATRATVADASALAATPRTTVMSIALGSRTPSGVLMPSASAIVQRG